MKAAVFFFIIFMSASFTSFAEEPEKSEQQIEMKKLSFLVGEWAGPGQSFATDGSVSAYYDTEKVYFDVQGSLLVIHANGTKDGQHYYAIHTVIYYDVDAKHYWYNPYTAKGSRPFRCDLKEQLFQCYSADRLTRFNFQRLPGGEWNEFGETLENGRWRKTFETVLTEEK